MKIIIEQDPGEAGKRIAEKMRQRVFAAAAAFADITSDDVVIVSRSSPADRWALAPAGADWTIGD